MNERALRICEWSALSGIGAMGFFQMFVDTPMELRRQFAAANDQQANLDELRRSYVRAGLWAAGLGLAASLIARSPVPALLTAGAAGAAVLTYESALPQEHRLLGSVGPCPVFDRPTYDYDGIFRHLD